MSDEHLTDWSYCFKLLRLDHNVWIDGSFRLYKLLYMMLEYLVSFRLRLHREVWGASFGRLSMLFVELRWLISLWRDLRWEDLCRSQGFLRGNPCMRCEIRWLGMSLLGLCQKPDVFDFALLFLPSNFKMLPLLIQKLCPCIKCSINLTRSVKARRSRWTQLRRWLRSLSQRWLVWRSWCCWLVVSRLLKWWTRLSDNPLVSFLRLFDEIIQRGVIIISESKLSHMLCLSGLRNASFKIFVFRQTQSWVLVLSWVLAWEGVNWFFLSQWNRK